MTWRQCGTAVNLSCEQRAGQVPKVPCSLQFSLRQWNNITTIIMCRSGHLQRQAGFNSASLPWSRETHSALITVTTDTCQFCSHPQGHCEAPCNSSPQNAMISTDQEQSMPQGSTTRTSTGDGIATPHNCPMIEDFTFWVLQLTKGRWVCECPHGIQIEVKISVG